MRRVRVYSPGGCIKEIEKMTGKTIRELALDAVDQALAESIRQHPDLARKSCELAGKADFF